MSITPPYLKQGDKIAVISTARKVSREGMQPAIETFGSWGLEVVFGENLFSSYHQFAGTDTERTNDLQWALDNREIKAIFCARGGYGTLRIIDTIDFDTFTKSPKWVVGYSDITALFSNINNKNIECVHAIMPFEFSKKGAAPSIQSLQKVLFGENIAHQCLTHPMNVQGNVSGKLIGGNLSMLHNLIGTSSDFDTKGKILFLEDVDEYLYHIDRMMVHLKRAGKLHSLAGLIVGHFSDMKDNTIPFGKTFYEIILEAVKEYNYPVCFGFPVGHEFDNLAMICGREAELEVTSKESILKFKHAMR